MSRYSLLLHREALLQQWAAELEAVYAGLKEQVLRNEQLKLRLAKLLRERFRTLSEKLRSAIDQLGLILGGLEEQVVEMTPSAATVAATHDVETKRQKPVGRPLSAYLPRETIEYAALRACLKYGGALRPLSKHVTDVLDYVPGGSRPYSAIC